MPSQIDITIRKELAMAPPPAFLSGTMRGAVESSGFAEGQPIVPAQILVIDEPGQPGQARSRAPDRMTKSSAGGRRSAPIVGPALVDIGRVVGCEVRILEAVSRRIIDPVRALAVIQKSAIEAKGTPWRTIRKSEPHGDLRRRHRGQSQEQSYSQCAGQHDPFLQQTIGRTSKPVDDRSSSPGSLTSRRGEIECAEGVRAASIGGFPLTGRSGRRARP
jgi:hypothetical protein